ncbi:uncharacterized protein LOC111110133 isoform X1 [Crassostrea virginica]
MARSGKEIVTLVLLVVTFGLWFIAMLTPGWFVFSAESPSKKGEIQMSLFYIKFCNNRICLSTTYEDLPFNRENLRTMPKLIEIQLEATVGVILCGICCILIISSNSCSSSKRETTLSAVVCSFLAVVVESVLVIRMVDANVKVSKILNKEETILAMERYDLDINLPYSVLITGVGLVFGVSSLLASCVLRSSLEENSGEQVISMVPPVHPSHTFTTLQEEAYPVPYNHYLDTQP